MNEFTDDRGTIKDLYVGDDYSMTSVSFSRADVVRGNHVHQETKQIDTIISGKFLCAYKKGMVVKEEVVRQGDTLIHEPGVAHAYKSLEGGGELLSVCFGKRVGSNYEKDTFKLDNPLL